MPSELRVSWTVTYRVSCSEGCTGDTYYQAVVLREHKKPIRAPQLDLAPRPVSIAAEWGGEQRFTHRYRSRTLRLLSDIVRAGGEIELRLSIKVKDLAGNIIRAQGATRLRA